MPRVVTPAMLAALQAGELLPAFFVQIQFISETVYLWTGTGNISAIGHTWSGLGSMLGIATVEEGSSVEARGVVISLGGFDPTVVPEILSDYKLGNVAVVYLGLFDPASLSSLIADPLIIFAGETDQPTVDIDGPTATISLACENVLANMNVAANFLRTQENQQQAHPGDLGLSFVDGLAEKVIYWGRSASSHNL